MRIAISISAGRISPVFDSSRALLLLDLSDGAEVGRQVIRMEEINVERRARRLAELGVSVLICGAITSSLDAWLSAYGVQVQANTCGPEEAVASTFLSGRWTEESFLMPGCCRRRGCAPTHGPRARSVDNPNGPSPSGRDGG